MAGAVQAVGAVLIAVILCTVLRRDAKETAVLLSVLVCGMVLLGAVSYLKPVIAFLNTLQSTVHVSSDLFQILLKAVGIGLISELVGLICNDCGNAAMGRAVEIMASAVILWLSLPLLTSLLELVQRIAGEAGR